MGNGAEETFRRLNLIYSTTSHPRMQSVITRMRGSDSPGRFWKGVSACAWHFPVEGIRFYKWQPMPSS